MPCPKLRAVFFLVAITLLALAPLHFWPSQRVAAQSSTYVEMECPADLVLDPATICGLLTVPENRANPESRMITLPIFTLPSYSDTPAPDPVVFLVGGPGQDASIFAYYTGGFDQLRYSRDVILLEQRGTLEADPALMCPEYGVAVAEAYMSDLPPAEAVKPAAQVLLDCRAKYIAQGIDTNAYTTTENAADIEDLRVGMGYEQWNLYGVSYGSNLALITLRDHPAGLRSVVVESVHPPTSNFFPDTPINTANSLYGSFAMCAADPDCAADYPDPEGTLFAVVDRLNEAPLEINTPDLPENILLNGRAYLFVIFNMLYSSDYLRSLPSMIYDNFNGDFGQIEADAPYYLYSWGDFATVMHYTIQCTERLAYDTAEAIETASDSLDPRLADMTDMDNFVTREICNGMSDLYLNPADHEPVVSDVPVLLVSGEYDPVTPPAYAEIALQTLSRGQHMILPGEAHSPSAYDNCGLLIIDDFLADPLAEAEAPCD